MPESLRQVPTESPPGPRDADHGVDSRLLQANERTMLAWARTGLAISALGFVLARIGLDPTEPGTLGQRCSSMWSGLGFGVLGTLTILVGIYRFLRVERALLRSEPTPPGGILVTVPALILAASSIALGAYLALH